MSAPRRILLINPAITTRSRARFPLSLMTLAAALEPDYQPLLIDGNLDRDAVSRATAAARSGEFIAAGITVMGGPQVATAIDMSRALRAANPSLPIVWGGYFPTLYPEVALNSDYVDYVVRGQGEETLRELLGDLRAQGGALDGIAGLGFRRDGRAVCNRERGFSARHIAPALRYDQLPDARAYLVKSFLGARTAAHQAALGCRFRCTFCGVAAMFRGGTALPPAGRLDRELAFLKSGLGADSIQFYDHNFFDREVDMVPLLEVLARHELPWWCYARADALVNLSEESWRLVRKSRLRMAYIGAETPNDKLLRSIRKGTRSDQTLEVAELCRRHGVIPELSFMVAPPEDPGGRNRAHLRLHPPGKARESAGGNHRLRLHAAAGEQRAGCGAPRAGAAARCRRQSGAVSEHAGGVDRAALGGLRLSRRCAVDERAPAPTGARFRHRAALPLSDRTGHALARLGQGRAAHAGGLAIFASVATIARGSCVPRRTSSACSIRVSRVSEGPAMHVVQVSFYVDPQARQPRELLRQWTSLAHIAGAVADTGDRVTVVQASQHRETLPRVGGGVLLSAAATTARSRAAVNSLG